MGCTFRSSITDQERISTHDRTDTPAFIVLYKFFSGINQTTHAVEVKKSNDEFENYTNIQIITVTIFMAS